MVKRLRIRLGAKDREEKKKPSFFQRTKSRLGRIREKSAVAKKKIQAFAQREDVKKFGRTVREGAREGRRGVARFGRTASGGIFEAGRGLTATGGRFGRGQRSRQQGRLPIARGIRKPLTDSQITSGLSKGTGNLSRFTCNLGQNTRNIDRSINTTEFTNELSRITQKGARILDRRKRF